MRRAPAPKKPAVAKAEPMETSGGSPAETGNAPAPAPAKGRGKAAAQKKAPAKSKGKSVLIDEEEEEEIPSLAQRMAKSSLNSVQGVDNDDIVELEDRLARHNIESSPDTAEGIVNLIISIFIFVVFCFVMINF